MKNWFYGEQLAMREFEAGTSWTPNGPLVFDCSDFGPCFGGPRPSKTRGHLGSGHIGRQDFHASLILFLVTFHLFYAKSESKRHHSIIISTVIWLAHLSNIQPSQI